MPLAPPGAKPLVPLPKSVAGYGMSMFRFFGRRVVVDPLLVVHSFKLTGSERETADVSVTDWLAPARSVQLTLTRIHFCRSYDVVAVEPLLVMPQVRVYAVF